MNKELTEEIRKAVRQFAFDIVMTEFGGDDSDPDDQDYATEAVDAWMEHWRTTGAVRVAAAVREHLACNTVTDQMVERAARAIESAMKGWTEMVESPHELHIRWARAALEAALRVEEP